MAINNIKFQDIKGTDEFLLAKDAVDKEYLNDITTLPDGSYTIDDLKNKINEILKCFQSKEDQEIIPSESENEISLFDTNKIESVDYVCFKEAFNLVETEESYFIFDVPSTVGTWFELYHNTSRSKELLHAMTFVYNYKILTMTYNNSKILPIFIINQFSEQVNDDNVLEAEINETVTLRELFDNDTINTYCHNISIDSIIDVNFESNSMIFPIPDLTNNLFFIVIPSNSEYGFSILNIGYSKQEDSSFILKPTSFKFLDTVDSSAFYDYLLSKNISFEMEAI